MTSFSDFGLLRPINTALETERHTSPTPIQAAAIPALLAGRDLLGIAQTGTGKTAAFALPTLNRLAKTTKARAPRTCRALVLSPTRELALQIAERFRAYGAGLALTCGLVIGGVSYGKQRATLQRGVDILVATPGRLTDYIDNGVFNLSGVEIFVLDEVDQMLDLGFIHAIRAIAAKLPEGRQNVFLSATMPPAIAGLAANLLNDPVRVEIPSAKPLKIDQGVMFLEKPAKNAALIDLVRKENFARGLVFTRTKHGADKLVRVLAAAGAPAFAIHGNRSQSQREKALDAFRNGKARILVATDIAARGIDVRDVTHVVNYDLPNMPETYTHRIGRTGRAGATGVAISFCSAEEKPFLRAIEKLTKRPLAVLATAASANGEGQPRDAVRRRPDGARQEGVRSEGPRPEGVRSDGQQRRDDRRAPKRGAPKQRPQGEKSANPSRRRRRGGAGGQGAARNQERAFAG